MAALSLAVTCGYAAGHGRGHTDLRPPRHPVIGRRIMKFLCLAYPDRGFSPGPGLVAKNAALGEAMRPPAC
jgi:hypothetical protein